MFRNAKILLNSNIAIQGLGFLENGLGFLENGLGFFENGLGFLENGLGFFENGLGFLGELALLADIYRKRGLRPATMPCR